MYQVKQCTNHDPLIPFINIPFYARFRKVRPVPVLAVEGLLFAVVLRTAPVVPLRDVPILTGALLAAGPFLITVPLLDSLDSLLAIDLRVVRVPGREVGALEVVVAGNAFLFLVAAVLLVDIELVVEFVVILRPAPAPARVAFAFSTMLDSIPEAVAGRFSGEAGRAIPDLVGDGGRFAIRELEDVGDKICPDRACDTSVVVAARALFLAVSVCSTSFSLSPEMASLDPC
jgi:hypothetical protein